MKTESKPTSAAKLSEDAPTLLLSAMGHALSVSDEVQHTQKCLRSIARHFFKYASTCETSDGRVAWTASARAMNQIAKDLGAAKSANSDLCKVLGRMIP